MQEARLIRWIKWPVLGAFWLSAGIAPAEHAPQRFSGGMNKEYFAKEFLNEAERERIAGIMCAPDAYLMQCTGPLTKAQNPADNGKHLTESDCRGFFMQQMATSLQHSGNVVGSYYNNLPVNMSDAQAGVFRKELTQAINKMAAQALANQGADLDQQPPCLMRLMHSLKAVEAG